MFHPQKYQYTMNLQPNNASSRLRRKDTRLRDCQSDSPRIGYIVLVAAHECLDCLASHELDLMSHGLQTSCPMLGSTTSLHTNQARRHVDEMFQESRQFKLFADHFASSDINPVKLEHLFGDVYSDHGFGSSIH